MRRLSVLAAMLLVALAAAIPAAADAPVVSVERWEQSDVSLSPCGFPIAVDGWVEQTRRYWSDGTVAGSRSIVWIRAEFTWVGPTGRVAWLDQSWQSYVEGPPAKQTITGVLTRVLAPGVGVLVNDVGRLILPLVPPPPPPAPQPVLFDRGGQDSIFEPGVWDPVCAYLAG